MMPLLPVSRWSLAAVACSLTLMSAFDLAAQSTAVFLGERLSRTIPERMSSDDVPGAVVVVLDDGAPVWTRAFGLADPATGRPMSEDALFRVESISKPVTAGSRRADLRLPAG